jgi:sugar fermentation stimulation protein A
MKFKSPLFQGKILERYKRFFTTVLLDNGDTITAHTPNTGSMTGCLDKGWPCIVSHREDPKRKLKYTLELTHNGNTWIGVNTHQTNLLALEAFENNVIVELRGYSQINREVKVGSSRIDFCLKKQNLPDCYVEVKNVTYLGKNQLALFPDAPSIRGQKHLNELIELKRKGNRAVMLYVISRKDAKGFGPAIEIDPEYGKLFKEALQSGVEILAYQCHFKKEEIFLQDSLPLLVN